MRGPGLIKITWTSTGDRGPGNPKKQRCKSCGPLIEFRGRNSANSGSRSDQQQLIAADETELSANTKVDAATGVVFIVICPYDIRCRRLSVNGHVDDFLIDDHVTVIESSDSESQPEPKFSSDEGQSIVSEGARMLPIYRLRYTCPGRRIQRPPIRSHQ